MAVFDQRSQSVDIQYNAGENINFGDVRNKIDLVRQLETLHAELDKSIESGVLNEEVATDADYNMKKAIQQAKKPDSDKSTLTQYLTNTKDLIQGVSAASGLVGAITKAIEVVQGLF